MFENIRIFATLACCLLFEGCQRKINVSAPIKIKVMQSLDVRVGEEIRWQFKAFRNEREVKVKNVTYSTLPFGLMPTFKSGEFDIAGKVLGDQFRSGQIIVEAFDDEGCRQSQKNYKVVAVNIAIKAGKSDVGIPIIDCINGSISELKALDEHYTSAKFDWRIIEHSTSKQEVEINSFLKTLQNAAINSESPKLEKYTKTKPKTVSADVYLPVPQNIAPGSFDLKLGECSKLSRARCGDFQDKCLWNFGVCISASTTGRQAVEKKR